MAKVLRCLSVRRSIFTSTSSRPCVFRWDESSSKSSGYRNHHHRLCDTELLSCPTHCHVSVSSRFQHKMSSSNHHVVLAKRPGVNSAPQFDNFRYEPCEAPGEDLADGEVIIRNEYISVYPALRCQMNDEVDVHYLEPWPLDGTIIGMIGVGTVIKSNSQKFKEGDLIQGNGKWPWKLHFKENVETDSLTFLQVDKSLVGDKPSLVLSLLGLVGLTSFAGVRAKGGRIPGRHQTFVVTGAAGACGSLAGQIAKLDGFSNIVGICGSDEKCDWLTNDIGFNAAINYKTQNVAEHLRETCPSGIDSYFDNVGGDISDTIIKQMNKDSHIILCGQIADYNTDAPYPPPLKPDIKKIADANNITRDRFLVLDYPHMFPSGLKQLAEWYFSGQIKVRETVEYGLENTGKAFVNMMTGGNIGKQIVCIKH